MRAAIHLPARASDHDPDLLSGAGKEIRQEGVSVFWLMKTPVSRSSLIKVIPVAAIFVLAAFLRLYRLPEVPPGLHPDEAMNGINGLEAWRTGHFQVFYPG